MSKSKPVPGETPSTISSPTFSKRYNELTMKKLILSLFILVAILFFPSDCFAKNYTIDNANIDIVINKDGSANIKEIRTYTFSGHYENGWWSTGTKKACTDTKCDKLVIKNLQVKEGDRLIGSTTSTENNQYIVKWNYTADNESKNFTVSYTIVNAVNNYLDTAEFYWQIIQDGWGVKTTNLLTTIHLPYPAPDSSLKAWGHGPLTGKVSIPNNTTVVFAAKDIPANTFVEGRVIFPKLAGMTAENENALTRITGEEATWIDQTIKSVKPKTNTTNPNVALAVLLITGFLFFARIIYWLFRWKKVGRDLPLPMINLAGSLHEPPSNTEPALVEAILSPSYVPSAKSITATILELCRRKLLKITQEYKEPVLGIFSRDPEIWFELRLNDKTKLTKNEEDIILLLYLNDVPKISKSAMLKKLRNDTEARLNFRLWKSQFEDIMLKNGFLDKKSHDEQGKLLFDIIAAIVITGFLFFALGSVVSTGIFMQLIVFIIATMILSHYMDRLTPKGAQEKASWLAFKKYLKDYSVTKSSPLESVIIWGVPK
ncbi:DUF2207 domain-containing protein [bacterium]|nr:MAG: DUF2207 domain-containing protein [bacterium]